MNGTEYGVRSIQKKNPKKNSPHSVREGEGGMREGHDGGFVPDVHGVKHTGVLRPCANRLNERNPKKRSSE